MCGIAGFTGINQDSETRYKLTVALAYGIDTRGGHASGFVAMKGKETRMYRRIGPWMTSGHRFFNAAASADVAMMHARFATHGHKDAVTNAHPFAVKRNGVTVLYGAHNGVLNGTAESAGKNGRKHTVDSLEFFELLADKAYESIRSDIGGYGVVSWMVPGSPIIRLCRLSSSSDLEVAAIRGGGIVYGSTKKIVDEACRFADLRIKHYLDCDKVGQVFRVSPFGVTLGKLSTLKVNAKVGREYDWRGWSSFDWDETPRKRDPHRYNDNSSQVGASYYRYDKEGKLRRYSVATGEFTGPALGESAIDSKAGSTVYGYNLREEPKGGPKSDDGTNGGPKTEPHIRVDIDPGRNPYLTGLDAYDPSEKADWEKLWEEEWKKYMAHEAMTTKKGKVG